MNKHQLNQRLLSADTHTLTPSMTIYRKCIPAVICKDGATISVQSGEYLYCSPRNNTGPWETVEVGFPSVRPTDAMMKYCEDPDDPTNTVYGYVPIQIVVDFINEHGGSPLARH